MSSNIMLSGADVDYLAATSPGAFVSSTRSGVARHSSLILTACSEAGPEPLLLRKTPLICPTGNFSILLSSPLSEKYFAFSAIPNQMYNSRRPVLTRGAARDRHGR